MRLISLSVFVALFCSSAQGQVACPFAKWVEYKATPLFRNASKTAYLYASSTVKVDADGAPNAYHPDDVGLNCTHGTGFKGLDCPANAGYPSASWWPNALLPDRAQPDRAFVQRSGRFAGFFVSMTSLKDRAKADTDPAKYVDSTTVPYIVFPGPFASMKGTGFMGDLGYAMNLDSGQASPFVVAEVGPPDASLGEMSIALAQALGGQSPNPRTGAGTPKGKILYVVFPHSAQDHPWPQVALHLAEQVNLLLSEVGGTDAVRACKSAL